MTPCAPLTVDLLTNTATRGDISVRLVPSQAEILHELLRTPTRPATFERLYAALWGATGGSEDPILALRVYVSMLRKRLRPLNVGVKNVIGRGYILTYAEQPPRLASALIDAALAGAGA